MKSKKPRKPRCDSPSEAVRYASAPPIRPPETVPLDESEMPFFLSVIEERPRADWTPHGVEVAAILARTMRQVVRLRDVARSEPPVVEGRKNPVFAMCSDAERNVISLRRSLGVHARSYGEATDIAKRNAAGLAAQQAGDQDDGLLARAN